MVHLLTAVLLLQTYTFSFSCVLFFQPERVHAALTAAYIYSGEDSDAYTY